MIPSCQSKVCNLDSKAPVGDEDVLRLEVPMVDSNRMAEVHGIQNLQEGTFGHEVITQIMAALRDIGKEITFGAEFEDYKGAVIGIHDLDQGDDIGMVARFMMELDLSLLELALSFVQSDLVQGLDSIWDIGMYVDSSVDHPVSSDTQDAGQFQPVG